MYFCRSEFLDGQRSWPDALEQPSAGVIDGWLERICAGQRLQCPSVAVRRTSYEQLGGFDASLRFVLDWEMWIRIAASFSVAYLPESLAIYRMHPAAETRRVKAAGIATRDFAAALRRIQPTLERIGRLDCFELARRFALNSSTWTAQDAEASKERRAAMREIFCGDSLFALELGGSRRPSPSTLVCYACSCVCPRLRTTSGSLRR
jgi:hypothetical protein